MCKSGKTKAVEGEGKAESTASSAEEVRAMSVPVLAVTRLESKAEEEEARPCG